MDLNLISIFTPTYNEKENIGLMIEKIRAIMMGYQERYNYEHIIIDNASTDDTVDIIKEFCQKDKRVKLIVNARNFGHIRSPFFGLIQCKGSAVIALSSDFQDPPELIHDHITNWENGFLASLNIKNKAEENWLLNSVRKMFYKIVNRLSDTKLIENYTGAGLYDKKIIDQFRRLEDPYPYIRGLVSEIGFKKAFVHFTQPKRKRGSTKNNFYTLYDMAMLGITSHSKVPLRITTWLGFIMSGASLLVAIIYTIYKLIFWNRFDAGLAPVIIGIFFIASIQLFFIGIIGEYIGSIHTIVQKRPLVVEKERINFD